MSGRGGADLAMPRPPARPWPCRGTWCAHFGHWQGTGQRSGVDVSHRLATAHAKQRQRLRHCERSRWCRSGDAGHRPGRGHAGAPGALISATGKAPASAQALTFRTGWPRVPAQQAEGWPGGRGGADLAMLATGPAVAMPGTWCAHVGHLQGTGQRPGVDVSHRLATSTSAAGRRLARWSRWCPWQGSRPPC